MASVTLDRLWIHDADDLSSYVRFFTAPDRGDDRTQAGEVRQYAAGRQRLITRTGRRKELPVTLRQVTDDDLETLEDWLGSLVMVRDHRGRLMFASYFSLGVTDMRDRSGFDVAVTFIEVTHSIEV